MIYNLYFLGVDKSGEAVVQLQLMTEEKFDELIDPKKMI